MRPVSANVGLPDLIRFSACFVGNAIARLMPCFTGGSLTLTIGAQAAISFALGPLTVALGTLVQLANTNPRPSAAKTAPTLVMKVNPRPHVPSSKVPGRAPQRLFRRRPRRGKLSTTIRSEATMDRFRPYRDQLALVAAVVLPLGVAAVLVPFRANSRTRHRP